MSDPVTAMRPSFRPALSALALTVLGTVFAPEGSAQALGPQRRFIALGGYASGFARDVGGGDAAPAQFGGGARLMINLAPLSGPSRNVLDFTTVGGFYSHLARRDGVRVQHYGGEVNLHLTDVPIGYRLDPFVLIGAGALRMHDSATDATSTSFAVSPGLGLRIAGNGMLELRLDGRDVIAFDVNTPGAAGSQTTHNVEVTAGLNLRF